MPWVEDICTILVEKMAMFFVPGAISIILYFKIIIHEWSVIYATVLISTIVVLSTTGLYINYMIKGKELRKNAE